MNSKFPSLAAACLALLLAGCASTHRVKVDAIARPQPADSEPAVSYRIEPGSRELDTSSLEYRNAVSVVRTALSAKGMYEAPDPAKADMIVELDYGVSEPRILQETRYEPVYRRIETPAQIVIVPVGRNAAGQVVYERVVIPGEVRTVYDGERSYQVTTVTYEKHLGLAARANTQGFDTPNALWSIHAVTEGDRPDLRKSLPLLAAASMDLIGFDTRGEQTVRIREKDGAVEFIRQGM